MEQEGWITLIAEDGTEVNFEVIEETRLNGIDYLLVAEAEGDEEEAEALILKDVSAPEAEEAIYEIVENEEELSLIASIFEELLDDEVDLVEE